MSSPDGLYFFLAAVKSNQKFRKVERRKEHAPIMPRPRNFDEIKRAAAVSALLPKVTHCLAKQF